MSTFDPSTYQWARCVPELLVSDIQVSLAFYKMLGFVIVYDRPEKNFAYISYFGAQLMLDQRHNSTWETAEMTKPYGRGINLQMETDEIDALIERLHQAGHPLYIEKKQKHYKTGDTVIPVSEFLVQDPDGYLLRFIQ